MLSLSFVLVVLVTPKKILSLLLPSTQTDVVGRDLFQMLIVVASYYYYIPSFASNDKKAQYRARFRVLYIAICIFL